MASRSPLLIPAELSSVTSITKDITMKKIIAFTAMFFAASAAFSQSLPVSASYDGRVSSPSVSATATAQDVSAPYIGAMDCCTVSNPVSAPQMTAQDDSSNSLAMAGLGFGLFGLVGLTKFARRKKQK
jgi:hypothetical protein